MRKILLLLLSLLCGVSGYAEVRTVKFRTGSFLPYAEETLPEKIVTTSPNQTVVKYELIDATIIDDGLYEGSKWLRVPSFGLTIEEGTPSLPFRIETFELPVGCDSVSVKSIVGPYFEISMELTPSRPPLVDSGDEDWTKNNVKPVRASSFKGDRDVIKIIGYEKYRGRKRVCIQISPVQYNLATKAVRVYYRFIIQLDYIKSQAKTQQKVKPLAAVLPPYVKDTIVGGSHELKDSARKDLSWLPQVYTAEYAVVTTPKYLGAAKAFAEHKSVLGYNMTIYSKYNWTEKQVKDSLQKFYDENDNPMFALIIGGHQDVPGQRIEYNSRYNDKVSYTDCRYACMDGDDDMTPDFYIGRLPVRTLIEANIVVDKIKNYEMTPPLVPTFYQNGMHAAYFQKCESPYVPIEKRPYTEGRRFVKTSEDVRNHLLAQGKNVERIYTTNCPSPKYWNEEYGSDGEIPKELQNLNFYNNGTEDVVDSFNAGRFYVLHRDHGAVDGWGDPSFRNGDIVKLSNQSKLPVVFSLNCQSGNYAASNGAAECFAEKILKHPYGGSVAVIASSHTSYSGLNDQMCLGMFQAIWPEPGLIENVTDGRTMEGIKKNPSYRLGEILDAGKEFLKTQNNQWSGELIQITLDRFHVYGDPSMMIRTEVPWAYCSSDYHEDSNGLFVYFDEPVYIAVKDVITGKSKIHYGKH